MMLDLIIKDIATQIKTLPWATKCGAIAQELLVKDSTGTRKLPSSICAPFNADSKLEHLTPDECETVVCWFEAKPTRILKQTRALMQCQNEVQLVLWINTRRLYDADSINAEISIINKIRHAKAIDQVSNIAVEYQGDQREGVFSRWSFNETETQITMQPYRAAAHNFIFTYWVSMNCPLPIITIEPDQCP